MRAESVVADVVVVGVVGVVVLGLGWYLGNKLEGAAASILGLPSRVGDTVKGAIVDTASAGVELGEGATNMGSVHTIRPTVDRDAEIVKISTYPGPWFAEPTASQRYYRSVPVPVVTPKVVWVNTSPQAGDTDVDGDGRIDPDYYYPAESGWHQAGRQLREVTAPILPFTPIGPLVTGVKALSELRRFL